MLGQGPLLWVYVGHKLVGLRPPQQAVRLPEGLTFGCLRAGKCQGRGKTQTRPVPWPESRARVSEPVPLKKMSAAPLPPSLASFPCLCAVLSLQW